MANKKGYEVDRAVTWVAFGAAWYYFIWPEYLILSWGPTLVAAFAHASTAVSHGVIIWGICSSAVFLFSLIFRKLGMVIAFLLGCVWGAAGGAIGYFATGQHWYWGALAGIVVLIPAWAIHHAALVRPA